MPLGLPGPAPFRRAVLDPEEQGNETQATNPHRNSCNCSGRYEHGLWTSHRRCGCATIGKASATDCGYRVSAAKISNAAHCETHSPGKSNSVGRRSRTHSPACSERGRVSWVAERMDPFRSAV